MYSFACSDILSLARVFAVGGSAEPAYPALDADWYAMMSSVWRSTVRPRLLRHGGESYVYKTQSAPFVANQGTYSLRGSGFITGSDFYAIREIVIDWDASRHEAIPRIDERQRAEFASYTWTQGGPKGYLMRASGTNGHLLEIVPPPSEAFTATVSYIPQTVALTASSIIMGPAGVDLCLALELAIMSLTIQHEPTADLQERLKAAYRDLAVEASNQHHDQPMQVVDIYPEYPGRDFDQFVLPRA